MKPAGILSAEQIRLADAATISRGPVSSFGLMETAAAACTKWISQHVDLSQKIIICCGEGNNGGDGLAVARMLLQQGKKVLVLALDISGKRSADNQTNLAALIEKWPASVTMISSNNNLPQINEPAVYIDALFGTGINRVIEGLPAMIIEWINTQKGEKISIDMPSGLFADAHTSATAVVRASHTLSFELPKLAFLFPENAQYVGGWHLLPIGLDKKFLEEAETGQYFLNKDFIESLKRKRPKFSHKGSFGHAAIVAGSYGKMGAAVLAVKACLRSGAGLVTAHIPACGNDIMQLSDPEAMTLADVHGKHLATVFDSSRYQAIGIGPGIGTETETRDLLFQLLQRSVKPLVLDADALNILAQQKENFAMVPANSILTPHPKEFERMAGKTGNDFERHTMQKAFSVKYSVYIVLKGAYTCITTPSGKSFFNSTGNPGMAKGGSGDVLTGILTGLLAQGYSPEEAALLGVYTHGLAGDIAAAAIGETGMTAMDICRYLPEAWL